MPKGSFESPSIFMLTGNPIGIILSKRRVKLMTEQQFYKELGQQVKSLREARGLNPAQLANNVGIPRSLLVRFEEDGKKMSAWRMNQLLKFFELGTLENLFHPEKKTPSISTYPCQPVMA
jgi:ribosome-binding protein aMBF1 (putative translation factor)